MEESSRKQLLNFTLNFSREGRWRELLWVAIEPEKTVLCGGCVHPTVTSPFREESQTERLVGCTPCRGLFSTHGWSKMPWQFSVHVFFGVLFSVGIWGEVVFVMVCLWWRLTLRVGGVSGLLSNRFPLLHGLPRFCSRRCKVAWLGTCELFHSQFALFHATRFFPSLFFGQLSYCGISALNLCDCRNTTTYNNVGFPAVKRNYKTKSRIFCFSVNDSTINPGFAVSSSSRL